MDKCALITGAGQGIGSAIAQRFATQGIKRLILVDRAPDVLEAFVGRLTIDFPDATFFPCVADIANRPALQQILGPVLRDVGPIDILVNNAGIATDNALEDVDTWHEIINVNLHGTYYVTLEVINTMRDGGRIVNLSSVLGRAGVRSNTANCASKHAILGFTKALAIDLAPRQITVNAVLPARVDTPMLRHGLERQAELSGIPAEMVLRRARKQLPIRRFVDPEEVAAVVAFLASDDAAAITGQSYVIDGGLLCGV